MTPSFPTRRSSDLIEVCNPKRFALLPLIRPIRGLRDGAEELAHGDFGKPALEHLSDLARTLFTDRLGERSYDPVPPGTLETRITHLIEQKLGNCLSMLGFGFGPDPGF